MLQHLLHFDPWQLVDRKGPWQEPVRRQLQSIVASRTLAHAGRVFLRSDVLFFLRSLDVHNINMDGVNSIQRGTETNCFARPPPEP